MKKFFKALALVLALVLVIGAIPASAATTFTMKKDVKRVYLGGAQGKKEDGTQCKTKSKYRISKLINGFDPATMTLKLESSDKKIVKTSDSKRKVYGKKIGSATVKISVYDKESGILLDNTLSATIEVKKNADPTTVAMNVKIKGANGDDVAPTDKFALNTPYTVIISRKDADGNMIDTDKRSLVCTSDNKDNVEIVADNEYTTKYKVTFKKDGDYIFTISNYQSKTWNAPISSFELPVKAGYTVKDVKQVALDKVMFTFDTEVNGLTAENFNTYYEVDGKPVYPTAAQSVAINPEDKTQATVTFLSDFIGGEKYYFEYGDAVKRNDITYKNEDGEDVKFFIIGAKIDADSADKIIIPKQKVTAGETTAISYQIVDKNGIDITSYIKELIKSGKGGEFLFEVANDDIDVSIMDGNTDTPRIFISKVKDPYTIKATYTWWSNAAGKPLTAVGQGTVESVAEATLKRDASKFYGIVTTSKDPLVKDKKTINTEVTALSPYSVTDENVYLQAAVAYVNDQTGEVQYEQLGEAAIEFDSYYIKSSNDSVVMVGERTDNYVELLANQKGSASLIIYGRKAGKADTFVGFVGVNVVEARKASKISVSANKKNINTAMGADDSIKFDVKLFDQFEKSGTIEGYVTVELSRGNAKFYNKYEKITDDGITVHGNDFYDLADANNVVVLKFTLDGSNGAISETVQINVGNETSATKQNLVVTESSLETVVKSTLKESDRKTATIKLVGETEHGYVVTGKAISFVEKVPSSETVADPAAFEEYYVYTVARNGALVKAGDMSTFGKNGVNTLMNIYTDTTDVTPAAVKLQTGTYTITAYKVSLNKAKTMTVIDYAGKATLTVTETKPKYSITTTEIAERLDATKLYDNEELKKAFKVVYDGEEIKNAIFNGPNTGFTVNDEIKSAYVGKVRFSVGNPTIGYETVELPAGPNNGGQVVRGL